MKKIYIIIAVAVILFLEYISSTLGGQLYINEFEKKYVTPWTVPAKMYIYDRFHPDLCAKEGEQICADCRKRRCCSWLKPVLTDPVPKDVSVTDQNDHNTCFKK